MAPTVAVGGVGGDAVGDVVQELAGVGAQGLHGLGVGAGAAGHAVAVLADQEGGLGLKVVVDDAEEGGLVEDLEE